MMYAAQQDLNYYARQSEISSPGKYADLYADLPNDIYKLCDLIQGFVIHAFWISDENYGVSVDYLKKKRNLNSEYNLRSVEDMLGALMALDSRSLSLRRDPEERLVGNCRDFALILTSILRYQGIPARVRSGVARYFFDNGKLEDHFITEWWNDDLNRWQYTDPQIDTRMKEVCGINMDMTDLPREQFLHAGLGYAELVEKRVSPDMIGIFEWTGLPYVRYKLVSDLACLNKVEILAWEGWGLMTEIGNPELNSEDQQLLDTIALLLQRNDTNATAFSELKALFEEHPRLQIPDDYQLFEFKLPAFG